MVDIKPHQEKQQGKTQEAIKRLKQLWKEKRTGAVPAYEDETANGLTKMIIDYIKLKGYQAERINCFGNPIPNGDGTYRMGKTTMHRGTSDISATIKGKSVKIEIKTGKDRMSTFQLDYKEEIERAGGIYIIARSFVGFLVELHQKIKL